MPALEFDVTNGYEDPRTDLSLGDGDYLRGVHASYDPSIVSDTLVQGAQQRDGSAFYSAGNGTTIITFLYTVRSGDSTGSATLVVKSINFDTGSIVSPITLQAVSTVIPDFRQGKRFMIDDSNSLGVSRAIFISTASPSIVAVTSTLPDGVYTLGDVIPILLMYDLPVKVVNGVGNMIVVLSTGQSSNPLLFNRRAIFIEAVNSTALLFEYTVGVGDVSPRLDVVNSNSLMLGGASIYLDNSTNDTNVSITLPSPGTEGSLSFLKNIIINTQAPLITSISVYSENGTYTAGDSIYIDVTYSSPIVVIGEPILWLTNPILPLNVTIIDAPAYPTFAYGRALPGFASQLVMAFSLNWNLHVGDIIAVSLSGFSIPTTSLPNSSLPLSLAVSGPSNISVAASWISSNSSLQLTMLSFIPSNMTLTLALFCAAGLRVPLDGISNQLNTPTFTVYSLSLEGGVTLSLPFSPGYGVGILDAEAVLTPLMNGSVSLLLTFSFPEYLSIGDSLVVSMPGFTANSSAFPSYASSGSLFSVQWTGSNSTLLITLTSSISPPTLVVALDNTLAIMYPSTGVDSDTLSYGFTSLANGAIPSMLFDSISHICGFLALNLSYLDSLPSSVSSLEITFTLSGTSLNQGDLLVFILGGYPTSSGSIIGLESTSIDAALFNMTLSNGIFTLQALQALNYSSPFSLLFGSDQGFAVPANGISLSDKVFAQIFSASCEMPAAQIFTYGRLIASVQSPLITITSSDPSANMAVGVAINLTLSFDYSYNFTMSDELTLQIPYLYRNPLLLHEVNITSILPISCIYDLFHTSLIMTFFGNFTSLSALNAPLNVTFSADAGLSISNEGLPSDSMYLSIESLMGSMGPLRLSTPCIGFCDTSISYSTIFANEPLVISTLSNLSLFIPFGTVAVLDLTTYQPMASGLILTALNNSFIVPLNVIFTLISLSPLSVNFTMPFDLIAFSNFSITISGLSFIQGSADILGPRLSFQGTRLNMNGSLFTTFSPPNAVFDVPLVVNTSLFFGNLTAGGPSEVTISLVAIDALANSSEIRLTLPNFILTTTLNQIVSLSSSALITYVANSSSVSGITLEILLLQSVSANSVFTCSIIGLSLPVQGLTRLTLPSLDFPSFSFILSAIIISPPTPIVVFNDVTAIYQSIVSFITSSGRSLSSIGLSFIFNSNLSMGDSLSVYLPLLESQSISYFLMTTLLFNASWSAGMFTLDLTLLQPLPTGLINLTIPATNGTFPLSLPMQGYYSTEAIIGSITIQQMSLGRITTSALALPCYGVCSASATVGTPRAGYASSFFFSIVFGGQAFTSGDSLSFTLTGFDTIPLTGSVLTSNSNSISVSWNVSTSILLVVALSPFPLSEMLNFSLPADQVLALPLSGIRPVNAFNVTWISGAASLITQAPVLTFQNVGAVLQSSLLISPLVPGKVSQFNISLQLVDELQAGDVWLIGLPGYTIPSGDIPDLQCNFNVSAAAVFGTLNTFTLRINQMIPALSIVNVFVPLSAGFVLSILGFGLGGALPFMSIASSTSPIANTNFITFSSVGSMFPSSFTAQGSMLYFNFTLQCSLEAGSKIVVSLPNIVGPDETIPSSNSYSPLAISSGLWLGSTQTIEFFVVTTIPANILLEITAQTFSLAYSNAIYYTDDYRFTFSIQSSPLCAMDSTSFDSSSSSLLSYSFVAFSTPIVSRNTNIIFNLTADFAILKNDMIFVSFPYFASLNSSLVNPPINTTSSLFVISGASIDMNGTFSLNLTAQALIPSDTMISITLISSVFIVPPTGVLSSSFYPLAIIRASSSGGNILLAHGSFASVQPVGYFVLKTVQVLNPVPGMATGLLISWEIGADSSTGDVVVLRLPGFLCSNLSYTGAIPFSSSAPAGLSITWIPLMNEMQISFLRAYSTQVFKVSIPLEAGFLAPSYGISGPMGTYMIELLSTSFPVLWTDLDSISIVPIALAELSFLSCEAAEAYESTGDFFSIFLAAGHGLNSGDAGALIQIQDQIYQIGASTSNSVYLSSDENIMALTRAFNGSTVFDGLPATQIFTSPIRPAIYFGGNNSATIRFSYFIRRGDSSDGIQVLNTASSFFVSSNPDLNGGHLYRASMQPSLDSRQVIPSFPFVNTGLIIDTSRPVITAFTTTSPVGTYAEGEMLDLSVQFNLPVAIKNGSYGAPSLLIHVNPYSYGVAIYVAGSGSNTLTFAYQVIIQNLVTSVNASLITTSFPVIQPLRAISNNYYGYIRRYKLYPFVRVNKSTYNNVLI